MIVILQDKFAISALCHPSTYMDKVRVTINLIILNGHFLNYRCHFIYRYRFWWEAGRVHYSSGTLSLPNSFTPSKVRYRYLYFLSISDRPAKLMGSELDFFYMNTSVGGSGPFWTGSESEL
jgi:hypothetical protein